MTTRVIEFARAYRMFRPGDRVLCAVSGGADSMAMLHMLHTIRQQLGISLCCAHYNHGIRGAEALRDEDFVRRACLELDVPFQAGRGDVTAYAARHGMGLEEAGRTLRYAFLESCAGELDCTRIATAHNAADNAETMLLNLLRGTGLRGACGIAPVRGAVVRPLLCLDRPEIEAYLAEKNIAFVTDSTNLTEDYARNRLRRQVIAPLRELEPNFARKMLSASGAMRTDEDYLQSLTARFLAGQGEKCLSVSALRALPEPVAVRAVLHLAPGASRRHVRSVLALAAEEKPHGSLDLPGMRVLRQYDELRFGAPEPEMPEQRTLSPGETVFYGDYTVSCACAPARSVGKDTHYFCFKTEEICGKISVSPRSEGDRLRPLGRGVTKTLKKLFSEARIPPEERGRIPVLRDEKGVLAVYGFGQDERAAAKAGERALVIEINKNAEE